MYFGDGGKIVHRAPSYATVPVGGSATVPIHGADALIRDLPDADLVVALVSVAVPMASYYPRVDPFDVGMTAENFDAALPAERATEPLRLTARTVQIAAVATIPRE